MKVKCFEKSSSTSQFSNVDIVEAMLDSSEILTEGLIDELDPVHRNLHYIEALEDCVLFDVLLPHYDL